MLELITQGGWLMTPILAGSVIALGVFIERLSALRRSRVAPSSLVATVRAAVEAGALDRAEQACRDSATALGRVLLAGLLVAGKTRDRQQEKLEEAGRREGARLERYVGVLGIVASIEPLLGLLGTVVGMISVFRTVVTAGVGDPAVLAAGIWAALITTAAGLTVAIPSFIAWRYLDARVADLLGELEAEASALVDALDQASAGSGK